MCVWSGLFFVPDVCCLLVLFCCLFVIVYFAIRVLLLCVLLSVWFDLLYF